MCGSKGHAVVAANVGGQAALLKKPFKYGESVVFPGRRKRLTTEEKPAGVVGNGEGIAVFVNTKQEFAFVVGAPELIGPLPKGQRSALRTTTHAAAALHQAVAIQHGMHGAFGRDGNARESADQAIANFASTPAGVLALHVQNVVLYLKRKLVGVAIRTPAPIGESVNATFLIAIEDLVTGLTGDPKLSAKFRHRLAGQPAGDKLHPLLPYRTPPPTHP